MTESEYLDLRQLAIRARRLLTGNFKQPKRGNPLNPNVDVCEYFCGLFVFEYNLRHKRPITVKQYIGEAV